jgi:hypothetical protein
MCDDGSMGLGTLRTVGLITTLSACSLTHSRPPLTTASQSQQRSCATYRPQVDSAAGAAFIVGGIAGAALIDDVPTSLAVGAIVLGVGASFVASAVVGTRAESRCEREVIALTPPDRDEPLHAALPASMNVMTCEQRRLDMYSRAVTGADPDQRVRLLTELPSCDEPTQRERAWVLTRMAALDAGAGRCDGIQDIAHQVFDLDVALHDVVLMSDVEVKHCLQLREL